MARQAVAITSGTTRYPTAAVELTQTAADATNKEYITLAGDEILIVWNSGSTARTFTITSVADSHNRSGDITDQAIDADEHFAFGPLGLDGWRQTNGQLYFEASHAEVIWMVYRLAS